MHTLTAQRHQDAFDSIFKILICRFTCGSSEKRTCLERLPDIMFIWTFALFLYSRLVDTSLLSAPRLPRGYVSDGDVAYVLHKIKG